MEVDLWKLLSAIGGVVGLVWTGFHRSGVKISGHASELHSKIDKVKDDYVRRDDLNNILTPLQDDVRGMNAKLDRLIERGK